MTANIGIIIDKTPSLLIPLDFIRCHLGFCLNTQATTVIYPMVISIPGSWYRNSGYLAWHLHDVTWGISRGLLSFRPAWLSLHSCPCQLICPSWLRGISICPKSIGVTTVRKLHAIPIFLVSLRLRIAYTLSPSTCLLFPLNSPFPWVNQFRFYVELVLYFVCTPIRMSTALEQSNGKNTPRSRGSKKAEAASSPLVGQPVTESR